MNYFIGVLVEKMHHLLPSPGRVWTADCHLPDGRPEVLCDVCGTEDEGGVLTITLTKAGVSKSKYDSVQNRPISFI